MKKSIKKLQDASNVKICKVRDKDDIQNQDITKRIESIAPEVMFAEWDTPLGKCQRLRLLSYFVVFDEHYFLLQKDDNKNEIFCLNNPFYGAVAVTKKTLGRTSTLEKYLTAKKTKKCVDSNLNNKTFTYKLWNTDFLIDVDGTSHELSRFADERDKSIYQYLIATEEEWIEIIALTPPEWILHKNMNVDEIVNYYLKNYLDD